MGRCSVRFRYPTTLAEPGSHYNEVIAKLPALPDNLVQVDLYADGVFDDPCPEVAVVQPEFAVVTPEVAIVKPEGSAWIDSETLAETSFHWQDLVPMAKR